MRPAFLAHDVAFTRRSPSGSYNLQEGVGLVVTPSLSRGKLCVFDGAGRTTGRGRVARSSHDACFVMAA